MSIGRTCLLAPVAWFCIPDSPKHARFLNDREREIAVALPQRQSGERENSGLKLKQVFRSLLDYKSQYIPHKQAHVPPNNA